MKSKLGKIVPRKLEYFINLSASKGLIISIPESSFEKSIADKIEAEACPFCYINVMPDASPEEIVNSGKPVVLIGNLSNSAVVEDLYYRFLVTTDLWYPGPSGYEIRMLLDPYGNGQNIIHIGYSDDEGLALAIEEFLPRIDRVIEYISEVHPTRLHITKSEELQIRDIEPPELVWMNIARTIYKKGYLGYLTGERELIEAYLDMWRAIVSYPVTKDDQKIKDLHLKMSNLIQSFRLLETAGLIRDRQLHSDITNYIVKWPATDQGLVRIDLPDYMHPEFPRQNHGMIPSLGLAFLIDYCKTYKFKIQNLTEWERLVEKAYFPYMKGSWKPVCDGTCHGWWLSQPALLEYGLIEPRHRYFENGGARKAADAAISLVNNNGVMPSCGDYNLLRAFPGASLRHAAAYYTDGRYKFVHDLAPMYLSSKYHVYMPRMFDIGLKPVVPKEQIGIRVTPMDPLIYNSWEKAPELVEEMLHTGPEIPLEKTFDKLSVRTGWEKEDQYLLLDGLGSNSNHTHSYPDALGIIDYYHHGESWIIAENGSKFPEPENNTILTIVRKGEDFLIPSFGELIEYSEFKDGYYILMKLSNYSKTNWTREIIMIKNRGLVITDMVSILEDGNYGISTHIRTPGKADFDNNTLTACRDTREGKKYFTTEVYCSEKFSTGIRENDFTLTYRNHKSEPQPGVPEEDIEAEWENRYHTKDRVVTSLDSRIDRECKKGDQIIFMHIAFAEKAILVKPRISIEDNLLNLCIGTEEYRFKTINRSVPEGSFLPLNKPIKNTPENTIKKHMTDILGDECHVIAIHGDGADKKYYVGHGKQSLSCLDNKMSVLWNKEIEREPTYCYWWELDYPSVVELKVLTHDGTDYIIAGCGDLLVRCLDSGGAELWRFQYINGVPGRIELFDANNDGIPEILVGGEVISNRSQCRVLNLQGKLLYELNAEFWTSRMTAYADAASSDECYVALGANRGRNLHLYRTFSNGNTIPEKMFEKQLGGIITDIEIDIDKRILTAVSSERFTVIFDFNGDLVTESDQETV